MEHHEGHYQQVEQMEHHNDITIGTHQHWNVQKDKKKGLTRETCQETFSNIKGAAGTSDKYGLISACDNLEYLSRYGVEWLCRSLLSRKDIPAQFNQHKPCGKLCSCPNEKICKRYNESIIIPKNRFDATPKGHHTRDEARWWQHHHALCLAFLQPELGLYQEQKHSASAVRWRRKAFSPFSMTVTQSIHPKSTKEWPKAKQINVIEQPSQSTKFE